MALSIPSFLFHDELSVGSGVDSAYVLQEKHDVVVEKHQSRGAADSTILFFPFYQGIDQRMILGLEQVFVLLHMSV
jgi:hypothetical protein